ncbi:MAG: hypothetical protein QGG84_08655 [Rhodospirillales bacterium]|nr:hypothetical protein [Rhodospirillales bacterium]
MRAPVLEKLPADNQSGWRRSVSAATLNGISVPALSSALPYFYGYRTGRSSADLIHAQRDFFGAHGYECSDRPGSFHAKWQAAGLSTIKNGITPGCCHFFAKMTVCHIGAFRSRLFCL